MPQIIGCIGCGNMGFAILNGFSAKLEKNDWSLCGHDKNTARMAFLENINVTPMDDIASLVNNSHIIILAVKPCHIETVMREVSKSLTSDKIVVSIAAGISISTLRSALGKNCTIVRCMPTTTALVGRGIFAFCADSHNPSVSALQDIIQLFNNVGICFRIDENSFAAYSGLIGAGPAYIYTVMQGLLQAGVTSGFTFEDTTKMIIELTAGCAELAKQKNKTFMQLRDEVCSPGGLTIAGVNVLDREGVTGIFVEAVDKAIRRGKEMEYEKK